MCHKGICQGCVSQQYVPSLTAMGSWPVRAVDRGAGPCSRIPDPPWTGVAGWELPVTHYKLMLPLAAWLSQQPQPWSNDCEAPGKDGDYRAVKAEAPNSKKSLSGIETALFS